MASEASKIRNECARKYGAREKRYKNRIQELETELSVTKAKLEDYDNMKRNFVKMIIYCKLSQEDKTRVLLSRELEEKVKWFGTLLGVYDSDKLQKLANDVFAEHGTASVWDILKLAESQGC